MVSLIFKDAEAAKAAIMASQQKEITKLYEDWADEIGERAKYYSHKSTASAPVSERYYRELQKQLRQTSQEVSNEIYKKIKSNIYTVADAVVSDNVKWLESFGFSSDGLNAAFSYVPHEIVQNLITGQIYDSGWSLSSRIWGDNEQTLKDIYQVMAKGLAENKPIYEIAKDLESYVRPSAKLPWNLRMADGKKIYKKQVDYNAQRLARTLVQHGYQQSFIATTQKNPFITEYVWRSNGSRVCDLCKARDGVHYKKTELPMDHPNGMCTMEPALVDDMIDQLADWFNSPDGTYPEIDAFAGNFGYVSSLPKIPTSSSKAAENKAQRTYTDRQVRNASKFIKELGMDNDGVEEYMRVLKSQSQDFQNAFVDALRKKVKSWEYTDGTSCYKQYENKIELGKSKILAWSGGAGGSSNGKQTLFHEIGHAIDALQPGSNNVWSHSTKFGFEKAMLEDLKALNSLVASGDKDTISALRAMIRDDASAGVQDAISAMHCKGINLTALKNEGIIPSWHHTQEYYERRDAKREAASELFANMCGAKVDPKSQEYMAKYFPKASVAFEEIIKFIGK